MPVLRILLAIVLIAFTSTGASAEMWEDKRNIRNKTTTWFVLAQFDKLEATASEFRSEKSRHSSGTWKLTDFYHGIHGLWSDERQHYPDNWRRVHETIDAWIERFPKSPTPRIVKSIAYVEEAWVVRGRGYAKHVPPTAWETFANLVNMAGSNLNDTKSVSAKDPHWYALMASIHQMNRSYRTTFIADVEEGIGKFPEYYQTYFNASDYFLPKWGGSVDELELFAEYALQQTKPTQGNTIYARIYWYLYQREFGFGLFQNSRARWEKMRPGIQDVLKVYQDEWNVQNFAVFACLAEDKAMTAKLLRLMSEEPIRTVWQDLNYHKHCKEWSTNGA